MGKPPTRLVNISLASGNGMPGLSVLTAEVEYNQRDRKCQVMKEKDVAGEVVS